MLVLNQLQKASSRAYYFGTLSWMRRERERERPLLLFFFSSLFGTIVTIREWSEESSVRWSLSLWCTKSWKKPVRGWLMSSGWANTWNERRHRVILGEVAASTTLRAPAYGTTHMHSLLWLRPHLFLCVFVHTQSYVPFPPDWLYQITKVFSKNRVKAPSVIAEASGYPMHLQQLAPEIFK